MRESDLLLEHIFRGAALGSKHRAFYVGAAERLASALDRLGGSVRPRCADPRRMGRRSVTIPIRDGREHGRGDGAHISAPTHKSAALTSFSLLAAVAMIN
jgi:hypothetical protein